MESGQKNTTNVLDFRALLERYWPATDAHVEFGIRLINTLRGAKRFREQGESTPFKMSYHLALVDLELSTNLELFSYIKSIFCEPELGGGKDKRISSRGKKSKRESSELKRICEGKVEDLSESSSGPLDDSRTSLLYSSGSHRGSQRGTLSTALCSRLPLCRKIFFKHGRAGAWPRESYSSSSDEDWKNNEDGSPLGRRMERREQGKEQPLPLEQIVGKININEPEEKALFGRNDSKLSPASGGVREFSCSVSNPLYKDYNPLGYVKSEDEVAREFIQHICHRFNLRMSGCFEGEPVLLDSSNMIRILRDELERA